MLVFGFTQIPLSQFLHAWWKISRRLYGLWVLGLTQIPLTVFARLVENLTDDSWALLQWVNEKKSEYSERSEYSEFCMVEGLGFV